MTPIKNLLTHAKLLFSTEIGASTQLLINGKTYHKIVPIMRHLGILYSYYPKKPIAAYEADWAIATVNDYQGVPDVEQLELICTQFDQLLSDGRPYLAVELSIADFYVHCKLDTTELEMEEYPFLTGWIARVDSLI